MGKKKVDNSKRKVAFKNVCDYCNKEFKTSMPFARFCSDNHRKYYANRKRRYEKIIQQKAIEESDRLIEELLKIGANDKPDFDELIKKITKANQRIKAYKEVRDNIDQYTKEFIKDEAKSKKHNKKN